MSATRAGSLWRRRAAATAAALALLSVGASARAEERARPMFADLQPAATPEATFETNAYDIIHIGKSAKPEVGEKDSSWRPVRGLVYRVDTDPAVFFESTGRPDLAGEVRAHKHSVETLSVGGYVLGIAGVVVTLWGFHLDRTPVWAGGLGAIATGIIMHETGESMRDDPPAPERQAVDVATDYNRQLRARLGLSPDAEPATRDRWTGKPLTLAPVLVPGGAGVGFAGHF